MTTPTTELTSIEKKVLIRAPRSRVWRALTTSQDFGKWFCAEVAGPFVAGQKVELTSTHQSCTGDPHFHLIPERIEPETLFSWRWFPGSAQSNEDGSTLVEFRLEDATAGGTLLTLTESGFDRIALARRAKALDQNMHGWEVQLEAINRYVTQAA